MINELTKNNFVLIAFRNEKALKALEIQSRNIRKRLIRKLSQIKQKKQDDLDSLARTVDEKMRLDDEPDQLSVKKETLSQIQDEIQSKLISIFSSD